MFFLLSGASGSGKTSIISRLSTRFDDLDCHDDDEHNVPDEMTRCALLEGWVRLALDHQQAGRDFLLAGQSPLGELLACPSAIRLNGISAALLDCRDLVRLGRIRGRGFSDSWRPGQDDFNWAAWHRLHAADPQWEQRVIVGNGPPEHDYARWTHWQQGDPRWQVKVMDTSDADLEAVVDRIANWVEVGRKKPGTLSLESKWWL